LAELVLHGWYLPVSDCIGDAVLELGGDALTGDRAISEHKLRTTLTGLQKRQELAMKQQRRKASAGSKWTKIRGMQNLSEFTEKGTNLAPSAG
jgi:hypothetical protein